MEELQLQLQSYSYDSIEKNVVYLPGLLNHSQHVCFDFTEHICQQNQHNSTHPCSKFIFSYYKKYFESY